MFLRISPEEYVNTEAIEHIRIATEMSCVVTTESGNVYTAEYPIETLLGILRGQKVESENGDSKTLQEISHKIGELPIFAG